MHLLTWHGTLLARTPDGILVQTTLEKPLHDSALLTLGLIEPIVRAPMDSSGMPNVRLLPGPTPGTVHFQQGEKFLSVTKDLHQPTFSRNTARGWETLLLIDAGKVEALEYLLSHAWFDNDSKVARGEIRIKSGFNLQFGPRRFDLIRSRFTLDKQGDSLLLETQNLVLVIRRQEAEIKKSILLRTFRTRQQVAEVTTEAAFKAGSDRYWKLPQQTDVVSSPIFIGDGHSAWAYEQFWIPGDPPAGRLNGSCKISRGRDVGVVLTRFGEGTLFDEQGVIGEDGYLQNLEKPLPPSLICENDALVLDLGAYRDAPVLPGSYIVFIKGNLQNYYHWLIDSLVALDIMSQYAPSNAKLLIPGTVSWFKAHPINRFDHLDVLEALGLNDHRLACIPEHVDFVRVEEAIWLEDHYIESVPGSHLRAIRDRLFAVRDRQRPRLHVYIRRAKVRGIANPEDLESFLAGRGFSFFELEDMPSGTQIALFQDAEFVVAPHGAGLANILFCSQGTKVIELSPDAEFRPFFWLMSNKLGLSHGILPSPTHDGSFNGMMRVDMNHFRRLFRMLTARL